MKTLRSMTLHLCIFFNSCCVSIGKEEEEKDTKYIDKQRKSVY